MLLSVILPFYRVAPYIDACLDSILPLPADQVELLFVDDRGEDETRGIIEDRIRGRAHTRLLRHEKNRGLSAARNTGLAQASGDYILFLDTDDTLYSEAILPLVQLAQSENLDILQAAYETFTDDGSQPSTAINAEATSVLPGEALLAGILSGRRFEPMVWQRLYRREFLSEHHLTMREGLLHEDELFTAPALLLAERAQVVDTLFYRYRCRQGGIMGGFARSSKWCANYLTIAQELAELSDAPPASEAKTLLRDRAAAIALSIAKNIPAYGLSGEVRQEALSFLSQHRADIAAITSRSGSFSLRLQGVLLRMSPGLFLRLYPLFA